MAYPALKYIIKCVFISSVLAILVGLASAVFLYSLHWATQYRQHHLWLVGLLPIGGFLVGLLYHYYGKNIGGGNKVWLNASQQPGQTVPFKMAPFVYLGTMISHFLGASAGREGTALQMATAISYQLAKPLKISASEKKILLTAAIAAGFGSVFGTPYAGAVFALEIALVGRFRYKAFFPAFLSGMFAHIICTLFGVEHTNYTVVVLPPITFLTLMYCVIAGLAFGLCAWLFCKNMLWLSGIFTSTIKYAPLRPFIGGVLIASAVFLMDSTTYIGLGIPTISASFGQPLPTYTFALKMVFTIVTLSAGFKGGEVTPLFFIGATLGNALVCFIPLPMGILAAMGFVAVFAGASKAPLACIVLGVEMFGFSSGCFIALASVISYFVSGSSGIYKVNNA
ncbi:MAG: chloride channel protein [Sphingobacteriales bacterium]|nr:MAG: chloride channel protein [Sphingobacteriales bacterium]